MHHQPATTLICTVGTSLLGPGNLGGLKPDDSDPVRAALADATTRRDPAAIAEQLNRLSPDERLCGAEINSIASLWDNGYVDQRPNLFFCHSDTPDGRLLAEILAGCYRAQQLPRVEPVEINGLQDEDIRQFRTRGLRNLARAISGVVRDYGAAGCAINATGGYKAQIAIGVLMGQTLGVPVYYKHERFSSIISFPPMPVSFDYGLWLRFSGLLTALESPGTCLPASEFAEEWDERLESLVEREEVDGQGYFALSATGQVFHEMFRQRFRTSRDQVLPPPVPASQKRPPRWEVSGHLQSHRSVMALMQAVTDEIPQVAHCRTYYYNPDLPSRSLFRLGSHGVEGIWSDGTVTAKFAVETSATTEGQQLAVVARLNEWLAER